MTYEMDCYYCGTPYDSASRHGKHVCPECREAIENGTFIPPSFEKRLDKVIAADIAHAEHGE